MQALPKQTRLPTEPDIKYIGTKMGQCPLCKETKQLLILKFGLTLCEDCLSVCIGILDYLQNGENKKTPTCKPQKVPATSKKPPVRKTAATKNAQASTQIEAQK